METIKRSVVSRDVRVAKEMNRQRMKDFQDSENALYNIIKTDMYVIFIIHLFKRTEWATPRVNLKVKYELWMIRMCQYGVNCIFFNLINVFFIFAYLFGCIGSQLRHVVSSLCHVGSFRVEYSLQLWYEGLVVAEHGLALWHVESYFLDQGLICFFCIAR